MTWRINLCYAILLMSIQSLTAKYRPLTFADVAGQDAIKKILSRAAAEDRVAPAYLFSGTRGVGKTTIARIFAKALNCVEAPTAEPCNVCDRCRQGTAGAFIDMVEIDGASHGRVDDARALKETVGYAPQEGNYKVIIIDEAHMLSTAAFNALLKTLEEPPPRVTFIMATTEARKFPATIISRCQHYVFQMLAMPELIRHLEKILTAENIEYEPGALRIIAKRGAGSVRDSMSLMGQALAMGQGVLREEEVRTFLGLAGQDVFLQLMESIHAGDLVAVGQVLRSILDRGLDIGFFLRELAGCWRNMFLLRQAGDKARVLLEMPEDEADAWAGWAEKFDPGHIHAAWQMVLEGQRKVMTSLEPALALELMLLNLASLPQLLDLSRPGAAAAGGAPSTGGVPSRGPSGQTPRPGPGTQGAGPSAQPRQTAPAPQSPRPPQQTPPSAPQPQQVRETPPPVNTASSIQEPPPPSDNDAGRGGPAGPSLSGPRTMEGFRTFNDSMNESSGKRVDFNGAALDWTGSVFTVVCQSPYLCGRLGEGGTDHVEFKRRVQRYFGGQAAIDVSVDVGVDGKTNRERTAEAENHPAVQALKNAFDAELVDTDSRRRA